MGIVGAILFFVAIYLIMRGIDDTHDRLAFVGIFLAGVVMVMLMCAIDSSNSEPITCNIVATTIYSSEDGDLIYKVLINKGDNELMYLYFNKDEYEIYCSDNETVTMSQVGLNMHESYK